MLVSTSASVLINYSEHYQFFIISQSLNSSSKFVIDWTLSLSLVAFVQINLSRSSIIRYPKYFLNFSPFENFKGSKSPFHFAMNSLSTSSSELLHSKKYLLWINYLNFETIECCVSTALLFNLSIFTAILLLPYNLLILKTVINLKFLKKLRKICLMRRVADATFSSLCNLQEQALFILTLFLCRIQLLENQAWENHLYH